VRDGQISPRELADQTIARIEATNPELNFLVTEAYDFADPADGPFRGVPMLVKELTETAGIRTTFTTRR
jgi:Asp-tRNA(Asn)/Glu-tRNA(Gln) amidotransferase A subunit family amidase